MRAYKRGELRRAPKMLAHTLCTHEHIEVPKKKTSRRLFSKSEKALAVAMGAGVRTLLH